MLDVLRETTPQAPLGHSTNKISFSTDKLFSFSSLSGKSRVGNKCASVPWLCGLSLPGRAVLSQAPSLCQAGQHCCTSGALWVQHQQCPLNGKTRCPCEQCCCGQQQCHIHRTAPIPGLDRVLFSPHFILCVLWCTWQKPFQAVSC